MLSNRVFPVLVVTAKKGKHSFIIVQIPVDISGLETAMYSNGRNLREGDSALKRKKPVLGYESQSNTSTHSLNANVPSESIQALSAAICCRTRILSGSWLQLVTQKAGYQCGRKSWVFLRLLSRMLGYSLAGSKSRGLFSAKIPLLFRAGTSEQVSVEPSGGNTKVVGIVILNH